jgi:hypothetical protein
MYTAKQTRSYPPEFTVASPTTDGWATFHGTDAKARAEKYADFMNTAQPATAEQEGK